MSTSSTSINTVQRQAWTEAERQAIQDYAAANSKSTWRQIKQWFESTYPNTKQLSQSQISKFINTKRPRGPSDVDPIQISKLQPSSKRIRTGKHPELDAALF